MRKAWRERKKAEAAEAARAKAKEPFQATPVPYPPSVLPATIAPYPAPTTDRPRPSTSAGEYTLGLPSHLVTPALYSSHAAAPHLQTSLGMAQPLVLPQAIPNPRHHTGLLFDMHLSTTGDGYGDGSSRPVTAPAHQHAPPAFGGLAADQQLPQQQPSHALGQSSLSVTSNGFARSRPLAGGDPLHHERRFSLPGSYMVPTANGGFHYPPQQQQPPSESMPPPQSSSRSAAAAAGSGKAVPPPHPAPRQPATPEMKMPQPVHAPSSYATLIGGSVDGGGGSGAAATDPAGEGTSSNRSPRMNEVAAR